LPDGGEALRQNKELGKEEYRDLAALEEPLVPADVEGGRVSGVHGGRSVTRGPAALASVCTRHL
jgi:hypothetical protein